jgi:hypothetical protein
VTGPVRRLTDVGELILINALCFGPFTAISLFFFVHRPPAYALTTFRAMRLVVSELLLGAAAVVVLRGRGWRLRRLGLMPNWSYTFAGIALYLGRILTWSILARALRTVPFFAAVFAMTPHMSSAARWPAALLLAIINPIYEEAFVAAYDIQAMSRYGAGAAIATSTAIRVLYHLYQGPSAVISVGFYGLIAAAVYWRWRSAWPLIVMHTIADAVAVFR